jgi:NAD+ kinase
MSLGRASYLTNAFGEDGLPQRLRNAHALRAAPLRMQCWNGSGAHEATAFNEVTLFRQIPRAVSITIIVDGEVRLGRLEGDGVLVATPLGSTAYNLSAWGPILPLDSRTLALTPLAPSLPRHWTGAILPETSEIRLIVQDAQQRPASATADFDQVDRVEEVHIASAPEFAASLLFDGDDPLQERQLYEQFE